MTDSLIKGAIGIASCLGKDFPSQVAAEFAERIDLIPWWSSNGEHNLIAAMVTSDPRTDPKSIDASPAAESLRHLKCMDALIRRWAPRILDAVDLFDEAEGLRSLDPIENEETAVLGEMGYIAAERAFWERCNGGVVVARDFLLHPYMQKTRKEAVDLLLQICEIKSA